MGKVGSSTVERSLRALSVDSPIYHPHYLSHDRVSEIEKRRRKHFRTEREFYVKRAWLSQYLRKAIGKGLDGKRWKIVTLVREPIARNISTYFENLEVKPVDSECKYNIKSIYYDFETTIHLDNLEPLLELFFEKVRHDSPLVYFDRELRRVFGIDVYASDFPKSIGYKIYEERDADVLLIRLENLNECANIAFKEFMNLDNFSLIKTNIGSEKNYAFLYDRFKNTIRLPASYIDRMYGSKYARHFYSEKEIEGLITKWCNSRA
jgi:hypothetical protein